jgi:hypothetical protein
LQETLCSRFRHPFWSDVNVHAVVREGRAFDSILEWEMSLLFSSVAG